MGACAISNVKAWYGHVMLMIPAVSRLRSSAQYLNTQPRRRREILIRPLFLSRSSMFLKHASSSKRELIDDKDDEDLTPAQNHKKARTASTVGASSQPTNKVMPAHINFPPKKAGNIRFATWNICSYAASQKKVRPRERDVSSESQRAAGV